ncbi:MAG TPA: FMN-binding protein, partial [Ideonella sp.]|nr:FMN-binding protein [Ideonella sp.]
MTCRNRAIALCFVVFALLAFAWPAARADGDDDLKHFLEKVTPAEVVPGADRFGKVQEHPEVAPAYHGDKLLGHVYLTSEYVDTNGYSGKPIHILVGLDPEGTIVGAKLVKHSEPIVLIGIPERKVVTYLQAFIGYNPTKAAAAGQGPPHPDIVSGATVTVLVMGESVVRSAVRVTRALQGAGAAQAGAQAAPATPARGPSRVVDPQAGTVEPWSTLLADGTVRHLHLSIGQVNKAFVDSGNKIAAERPEPGAADADFIDLYVALVSQPAIGRSLLGEAEYATVAKALAPGQAAILVAGDGIYSFKGSGYVRGGIFDRIELIQGAETVRFRDRFHRRVGTLQAAGAPALREIGVFEIPPGTDFDAAAPWRLQLLVQRATGALDKAFVSFELPYQLPARYTKAVAPPAGAAAAAPAASAAAP